MKNIEISHFYTEDFQTDTWLDIVKQTIEHKKIIQNFNGKKIILIDDKEDAISLNDKKTLIQIVSNKFKSENILIDNFFFEADFEALSNEIHKKIEKHIFSENFRKQNKKVYFFNSKDKKIALKEEKDFLTRHYCVSLSLAFSVFKNNHFGRNTVLIDKKYKNTENNVAYIKKYFSSNKDEYIYI